MIPQCLDSPDLGRLSRPWALVERCHHAKPYRPAQAPKHGLMGHANRLANRMGRWIGAIGQKDTGALDPTRRFGSRTRDPFELRQVVRLYRDIDYAPRCCRFQCIAATCYDLISARLPI
jgi:hypothetical protein